ncbi:helix-turn-helix transcriptional regulator [Maricaulis sp.]|uniref:helix-turn-helix domain-containing protein n=1 Tax=Maricaulis sp. TaxID=1486257 RepID=UPI002632426B|nr:helix-turn-helix transcriptional regulator [Maricaulis sp.]
MFNTFSTIAYAIAAGSLGFALLMAITSPGPRRDRTVFFALLLIALLVHMLGQLLVVSGAYALAPHLVGFDLSIKTILGPAIFFYTRALISPERPRFGGRDWWALLGPALVIVISLPFATLSAEEKLALVDPATRNPEHYAIAVFVCTASLFIFLTFTAIYLSAALKLQHAHRHKMMQEFANIERRSLDWLRMILLVFAGAWVFFTIKQGMWLTGTSVPAFNLALAVTESLAIAAFAYLGLRQPQLASDQPQKADVPARRQLLSEERLNRTASKLINALNTDALYADSALSLRKLSDVTGVTKNHISETLSQHLGMNFFDFVNSHRAAEAKRLLGQTNLTILEIGLEVGFNSRSTFNAAFKKHVGTPPSTYRTALRKNGSGESKEREKSLISTSEWPHPDDRPSKPRHAHTHPAITAGLV